MNSSRHLPQGDGQVERVNRNLVSTIAIYAKDQAHWDQKIKDIEMYSNNMFNKTTERTPYELLHGY